MGQIETVMFHFNSHGQWDIAVKIELTVSICSIHCGC